MELPCVFVCSIAHLCLTLCDPMDYSPLGSSVHGIFPARILEWVTISFSRGSSQPKDWSISGISCIGWQILHHWATWETLWLTIWSSNSTSSYVHKIIESKDSSRYLYTSVCSSIIETNDKIEAPQKSTKCGMYIQWKIMKPLEGRKFWYALQCGEPCKHHTE